MRLVSDPAAFQAMKDVVGADIAMLFGHGRCLLSSLSSVAASEALRPNSTTLPRMTPFASEADTFRIGAARWQNQYLHAAPSATCTSPRAVVMRTCWDRLTGLSDAAAQMRFSPMDFGLLGGYDERRSPLRICKTSAMFESGLMC